MAFLKRRWAWLGWAMGAVLVCTLTAVAAQFALNSGGKAAAHSQEKSPGGASASAPSDLRVEVVQPRKGAMDRISTQPGKVHPYESVALEAKVSGYMKTQTVDIGSVVEEGQPLIVINVPELDKQVERNEAALKQAEARVRQMKARIDTAGAELTATEAEIIQAEANLKSATAWRQFRELQLRRMNDLFASRSIEERLVDESKERATAAVEAENAARAAVTTARAKKAAAEARVVQAEADEAEAQADVKLAQAELDKARVYVDYATIRAPFKGVVTQRSLFPGSFVRAADSGASRPLLTVERIDKVRVVVQVADSDVPFATVGDRAHVRIDALDATFDGTISRVALSEDPQTCLMRVEIDLDNPGGLIRPGMYGSVKIDLDMSDHLSVPQSCLVQQPTGGKGAVYVIRNGRVHLVPVEVGTQHSRRVAILSGLDEKDEVVLNPQEVSEGMPGTAIASP